MKRKEIVLIKETRQNEFVHKIMDYIAPFLAIRASDRVAIKINLSGAKEIYANTHYETVESLIHYLQDKYGHHARSRSIEGSDGAFFSGKPPGTFFTSSNTRKSKCRARSCATWMTCRTIKS